MDKKFAFIYFMKNEPEKIGPAIPLHIAYWKDLGLDGCMGGPFEDRSGGMITFLAKSLDDANRYAKGDPFVTDDLLTCKCVKNWIVKC